LNLGLQICEGRLLISTPESDVILLTGATIAPVGMSGMCCQLAISNVWFEMKESATEAVSSTAEVVQD
jgi:hypothetical protein